MKKLILFLVISTSIQAQQVSEIKDTTNTYVCIDDIYTLPLTVKRTNDGVETTKLLWNHILHSSLGIKKDTTNYQNLVYLKQ